MLLISSAYAGATTHRSMDSKCWTLVYMPSSDEESGGDDDNEGEKRTVEGRGEEDGGGGGTRGHGGQADTDVPRPSNGGVCGVAPPPTKPNLCKLCCDTPQCKAVLEYDWPANNEHGVSKGPYTSFLAEEIDVLVPKLYFMKDGEMVLLNGPIFTHDAPAAGQWLLPPNDCLSALTRLRKAALAANQQPELNRTVLEQKNDDGLLELVSKWVTDSDVIKRGLETFGAFASDALLAPVLHTVLRSQWLSGRKARLELNNAMPRGWGSEFYDRTGNSSTRPCCTECKGCVAASQVYLVMRRTGGSPWSTLQALRAIPTHVPLCLGSTTWAAGVMEHASVEASQSGDWLARNETVIEFCALMYDVHKPREEPQCEDLEIFAQCIVRHRMAYEREAHSLQNINADALAAMFSVQHMDIEGSSETAQCAPVVTQKGRRLTIPDIDVLMPVRPVDTRSETLRYNTIKDTFLRGAPSSVSRQARPPFSDSAPANAATISETLTTCFPVVATAQLNSLDPNTGGSDRFSGNLWPVFVNRTRRCYPLFRALAFPVEPAPAYLLETLAQGWRLATSVLHRLPASAGPSLHVGKEHYELYFAAPLRRLRSWGVITPREELDMLEVLQRGMVPCFAGPGDSAPDRVVSATTALAFAACGLRMLGDAGREHGHTVTTAGLFYFAAWYVLVYAGISQLSALVRDDMARSGSDAEKLLLETIQLHEANGSVQVASYKRTSMLAALQIVFGRFVAPYTLACFAELYGAGLQLQIPYAKMLCRTPGDVKSALDSRDAWLATTRRATALPETTRVGTVSSEDRTPPQSANNTPDPPFLYLGPIDTYRLSTLDGLEKGHPRARTVDAWADEAYNLWYGTVSWVRGDVQAVLSKTLETLIPDIACLKI